MGRRLVGGTRCAAAFRSIFAWTTPADVNSRWDEVADILVDRFPKAAELMNATKADVSAFTAFPREHWRSGNLRCPHVKGV